MNKNNTLTGLFSPVFFYCAALVASLVPGLAAAQAMLLPTTDLVIGAQTVHVEIAATEASREHGLMQRPALPSNQGMVFVFDQPASECFWMKNTPLPLSIAFITQGGTIASIDDMQPFSEDVHCPPGPILYALEMQQGWFTQHRIKAGQPVQGLPAPLRAGK
jgi:uncharacterized membrane protein (UPF0127 family)